MGGRNARFSFLAWILVVVTVGWGEVHAADKLAPFVLASEKAGNRQDILEETIGSLKDQGFSLAGRYSPYQGTDVLVVTDDYLRKVANDEDGGIYLAGVRVSVAQVGDKVQVAYNNMEYLRNAYRVKRNLTPVVAKLEAALGKEKEFGARGLTPNKLRKYHYTFGMEYFDDEIELKEYGSQKEALEVVESNLKKGVGGASKVYRIDSANGEATVFGVALSEGDSGDEKIMKVIDFESLKSASHLPYELVVVKGEVQALHPRFRIALSFPDLKMVGDNSFARITRAPDAIEKALTLVAGGRWSDSRARGGFDVR